MRECGGIAALVALLAPGGSPAVQARAAAALGNLCSSNTRNQDSVRVCGGVAVLVGLLTPDGSPDLQRYVVGALAHLTSEGEQGRDAVRACGGTAALEHVLACPSSAAAHEQAAAVLRNLERVDQG